MWGQWRTSARRPTTGPQEDPRIKGFVAVGRIALNFDEFWSHTELAGLGSRLGKVAKKVDGDLQVDPKSSAAPPFLLETSKGSLPGTWALWGPGHDTLAGLALASRRDVEGLVRVEMHLWTPSQSSSDCVHLAICVSEIVKIALTSIRESVNFPLDFRTEFFELKCALQLPVDCQSLNSSSTRAQLWLSAYG